MACDNYAYNLIYVYVDMTLEKGRTGARLAHAGKVLLGLRFFFFANPRYREQR